MRPNIHYPPGDDHPFVAALRRAVAAHFAEHGGSSKADRRAVLRTVIVFAFTGAAYALLLGPWLPLSWRLGPAVALGLGLALIGVTTGHDALHGAFSRRRTVNRILGWCFDLMGASSYLWRLNHNQSHHAYTNIEGVDIDLDQSPVLRLGTSTPWRWWHRYQAFYAPIGYSLVVIKWHFRTDYRFFFRGWESRPLSAWLSLIAGKLWAYSYSIAIPILLVRPTACQFFAGYFITFCVAGLTMAIVFSLAHSVEGVEHPRPDMAGRMQAPFFLEQVRATMNFACENAVVNWLCAGLNYQIEHHLFPEVCSVHYPALRPIVRSLCTRHGVTYNEAPTVLAAVRSHFRYLHRLGRPDYPISGHATGRDR